MNAKKKIFIAFEGIDGSGKSTQVELLSVKLKKEGFRVYTTFEPTAGRVGSIIKDIMKGKMEADHRTIAGLFVADRLDHLLNKTDGILKKLEDGYIVIADRYYFSSYAYQGAHVPMEWVIEANSLSADILRPDLNIYIDIQPEISMKRLNKDRSSMEIFETTENLHKVRNKYLEAFEQLKHKENIISLDGTRSSEIIASEIWDVVSKLRHCKKGI